MKALTVRQPWASLLTIGAKRYITQSLDTKYRGPIAIHAGASMLQPKEDYTLWEHVLTVMGLPYSRSYMGRPLYMNRGRVLYPHQFPLGAVIATAELTQCYEIERTWRGIPSEGQILLLGGKGRPGLRIYHADMEVAFGDFTPGHYALRIENVQMLDKPVPARGRQGLWEWTGR